MELSENIDEVRIITKNTERIILTIRTQLLDESDKFVLLITEKIINKITMKTSTKVLFRKEINK